MQTRLLSLGAALLALSGCPGSLEDPERFLTGTDAGPTCNVEADILAPKCATAGCHDATTIAQNLDLSGSGVRARLRAQTATCTSAAGQPMGAFLLVKVKPSPTCGGPMPLGAAALTAAEIKCLEDYVASLDGGTP